MKYVCVALIAFGIGAMFGMIAGLSVTEIDKDDDSYEKRYSNGNYVG